MYYRESDQAQQWTGIKTGKVSTTVHLRYKNRQMVKNNHSPKFDLLKDTIKDNTNAGDEGF